MSTSEPLRSHGSGDLQRLKHENAKLQNHLDECRAQLLEHLREVDQVPDAAIRKDYERLCASIETWIDSVIYSETRPFKQVFSKVYSVEPQERILLRLGLYAAYNSRREYGIDRVASDRMKWLAVQKYGNCVVLTLAVWRFLDLHVFDENFPVGTIDDESEDESENGEGDQAESSGRSHSHAELVDNIYHVMEQDGGEQGKGWTGS